MKWRRRPKLVEKAKTEKAMREAEAPWPKSQKELSEYIESLVKREHDYGTCVYAMSLAATAAFNYVCHVLGTTGFQASCADLDILKRTRHLKNGFRIVDYDKLLYPQYVDDEHFPTHEQLLEENKITLSRAAKKLLVEKDNNFVHPDVRARWEYVASLVSDEEDAEYERKRKEGEEEDK